MSDARPAVADATQSDATQSDATQSDATQSDATQSDTAPSEATPRTSLFARHPEATLVGLALALHATYLALYAQALPFVDGPLGDSLVYLQQARDVLAGRLGTPALLAFSPLYGYTLAALGVSAASLAPLVLQAVLSALIPAVIHRTARARFGSRAGLAAAGLALSYAMLPYYASKLLSETLGLLLAALSLAAYASEGVRAARPTRTLAAGALLALAVLARASLVFALPLAVLAALPRWARGEARLVGVRRAALVAAGIALVLGANGAVNAAGSGHFVPVIAVSRTLETASTARFDGNLGALSQGGELASPFDVVRQAERSLAPDAVAAEAPSLRERLARYDVRGVLAQAPGKIAQTFGNREMTWQYGFVGERDAVPFLRLFFGAWSAFVVLALAGVWALARAAARGEASPGEAGAMAPDLRALWAHAPLFVGCLVTCVLYHPSSRYRLAMALPMFVLGGYGLTAALRAVATPGRRAAGAAVLAAALAFAVQGQTFTLHNRVEWEFQLAGSCLNAGDRRAAAQHAIRALEQAPLDPTVQRRAAIFGVHVRRR